MVKRVVIAGSRYYSKYEQARDYIDFCISRIVKEYTIIIVSGGCQGADLLGECYAIEHGLQIERYPAEWEKYGRAAGPLRNKKMAEVGDYFICFWDGYSPGTRSMIEEATKVGKPVKIRYI